MLEEMPAEEAEELEAREERPVGVEAEPEPEGDIMGEGGAIGPGVRVGKGNWTTQTTL